MSYLDRATTFMRIYAFRHPCFQLVPLHRLKGAIRVMGIVLALLLCDGARAQARGDSIVALYCKGKTVIGNYTIDTLLKYLNWFNENPHLRYVRFTEDDSRTGYYADFVLELKVRTTPARVQPPGMEQVRMDRWETRTVTGPDGKPMEQYVHVRAYDSRPKNEPMKWVRARAACIVNVRQKARNEQKSWFAFSASTENDDDLASAFLVELLHQLLQKKFRPTGAGVAPR
jgi:hypothetical protein